MRRLLDFPPFRRDIEIRSSSFEEASNSVEVVWTTGAKVRRYSWRDDGYYDEELIVENGSIRLDRLNNGAPFLDTHDDWQLSSVIGVVVPGSAAIRDGKGFARVRLSVAEGHRDIVANIKAGIIKNISVGYRIHRVEKTEANDGSVPVWRIVDWEPLEISAVPVPADAGSFIRSEGGKPPVEKRLAPCEFVEREANRREPEDGVDDERLQPDEKIEDRAKPFSYDAPRYESAIRLGPSNSDRMAAAIENAILHRASPASVELTAEGRDFRGMSLLAIARDFLEAYGVSTRGLNLQDLAAAALQQRGGGLHTTTDFPGVLANITNRTLRAAYQAYPQTFRPLVRETFAADFRPITRAQLGDAPALERLGENGEFKRGTIGEGKEIYRLATYGKIISISRQVLINDDIDAFSRLPSAFGMQAAQLESDLAWGAILSNPIMGDGIPLFHANHRNVMTAAAIDIAPVAQGRALFAGQTGFEGRTILGLTPIYLIVPVALQTRAEQFLGHIYPANVADVVPDGLQRLSVIAEPRLDLGISRPDDDINVPASGAAWYLAGRPAQTDIVELAYLEGNRGVYTETRNGFDVDGVEIKVRLDAAAKAIDWRNIAKNPGA
ncbi:HK97 family phage prohead protease [Rhizobium leguminosarum]|uniref:phage major capsid protein n=1 Tax=Rhizobium leguminosarum TaxID=384 RepID=UPI001C93EAF6|nr:HK97 family phage prohead protease [Rhizobium leguminosarum]MBY5562173.1 peptidase U37 [Rhizobium leguminosarum]